MALNTSFKQNSLAVVLRIYLKNKVFFHHSTWIFWGANFLNTSTELLSAIFKNLSNLVLIAKILVRGKRSSRYVGVHNSAHMDVNGELCLCIKWCRTPPKALRMLWKGEKRLFNTRFNKQYSKSAENICKYINNLIVFKFIFLNYFHGDNALMYAAIHIKQLQHCLHSGSIKLLNSGLFNLWIRWFP